MSEPRPIRVFPEAGQLAVVVSFRVDPRATGWTADRLRERLEGLLDAWTAAQLLEAQDLVVGVRVIGAGGERSEMEGAGP